MYTKSVLSEYFFVFYIVQKIADFAVISVIIYTVNSGKGLLRMRNRVRKLFCSILSAVLVAGSVDTAILKTFADEGTAYIGEYEGDSSDNQDTESTAETAEEPEETENTIEAYTASNTADVYRMYNPNSGEHFYTENYVERDILLRAGWDYEGIGWTAPLKNCNNAEPVYRVYNPNSGVHHYTMSGGEKAVLVSKGWHDEGVGWYSDSQKEVVLYRQYNPNSGLHNFTVNKNENDALVRAGWQSEGTAWYGVNDPDLTITHPATIYKQIDMSAVYDFNYYVNAYGDINKLYAHNDAGALKHFAECGLNEGRSGKASYDQAAYDAIKKKLHPKYPEAEAVFNAGLPRTLQNAFNYAMVPWVYRTVDHSLGTHYFAHLGYTQRTGNCFVMAGMFCELAKALGYNAVQCYGAVNVRGGLSTHSWVEIDGRVYDPDFQVEVGRNGFNIAYGQRGTLTYHKYGTMGE